MTSFLWVSAGHTDPGKKRSINQDAFLDLPERQLWAIADGMGGHQAGEIASANIIDSLTSIQPELTIGTTVNKIYSQLAKVNHDLLELASANGHYDVIGSTVVVLLVYEQHCVVLWSGDSRAYLFRQGELKRLTIDHNNESQLIEEGLSPKEAKAYPLAQALTHAIGVDADLYLDTQIQEVKEGDIYLLCSDGLNKELSDLEIQTVLQSGHSVSQCLEQLFELALQREARDNITILLTQAIR